MDARTQAIVNELVFQRNRYSDACAELSGEIAVLREQIAERDEKIKEMEKAEDKTEVDLKTSG